MTIAPFSYPSKSAIQTGAAFPIAVLAELPEPQFKLMNIRKFREASPERHKAVLSALEQSLI